MPVLPEPTDRRPLSYKGHRAEYNAGAGSWRVWQGRTFASWVPGTREQVRSWIAVRVAIASLKAEEARRG